jgi:hypothetical protein
MKSLATITTILLLTGCGSSTTIVGGPEDLGEAGAIGEAGQAPIDETGGMEQTGGTGGSTGGNLPTGGFATGGSPTGGSITGGSAGTISAGGQETGGTTAIPGCTVLKETEGGACTQFKDWDNPPSPRTEWNNELLCTESTYISDSNFCNIGNVPADPYICSDGDTIFPLENLKCTLLVHTWTITDPTIITYIDKNWCCQWLV